MIATAPTELLKLADDIRRCLHNKITLTAHERRIIIDALLRQAASVERAEVAGEAVRAAFKAGWYINAGTDVEPAAEYLAECEQVDWLEYQKSFASPPRSKVK